MNEPEKADPSEADLDVIRKWPLPNYTGLMAYVRERWTVPAGESDCWYESEAMDDVLDVEVIRYELATAHLIGNDLLIGALHHNNMFWSACWTESRRGGHYVFQVGRPWL